MAELATIARPYAEALFKAAGTGAAALAPEVEALAGVAGDAQLRRLAGNPKVSADVVYGVISDVLASQNHKLGSQIGNLLHAVIDNGRVDALPEIATQFQTLVNARSGVSDATVYSAFAIDAAQLGPVVQALERRFARKLNASVVVQPELIGGIRVVVGDEVLDTSVKARLEQMKAALSA